MSSLCHRSRASRNDPGKEGSRLGVTGHWGAHLLCMTSVTCLALELDAGTNASHRRGVARTNLTDYIVGGSWRQDTGMET